MRDHKTNMIKAAVCLQHFFVLLFLNRFYYPNSQDFCDFEKIIVCKYDKFCRIHKKGIEKGRNTTVKFRTSPLKCRLRPCYSRV